MSSHLKPLMGGYPMVWIERTQSTMSSHLKPLMGGYPMVWIELDPVHHEQSSQASDGWISYGLERFNELFTLDMVWIEQTQSTMSSHLKPLMGGYPMVWIEWTQSTMSSPSQASDLVWIERTQSTMSSHHTRSWFGLNGPSPP